MFFRNKFDKEFLFLCNEQPKGGIIRLDSADHSFWVFERRDTRNQPKTVKVIPLLLYNKIKSSNPNDKNMEEFPSLCSDMMLCEDKSDTEIECYYDSNAPIEQDKPFICRWDLETITGDLSGKDTE